MAEVNSGEELLRYAYISYLVLYIGTINFFSCFCLQAIERANTTFEPHVKFDVFLESECIETQAEDRTRCLRLAVRMIHK